MSTSSALVERLGFGDGRGNLSFNKMVTFTALWAFIYIATTIVRVLKIVPPFSVWSFGLACVCAGFGFKGISAFLQTRNETNTQTDSNAMTGNWAEVIAAVKAPVPERNAAEGIQPSGRVPEPHHD